MRNLRTGDPCPCCGQPIKLTDPDALRLLGDMCDLLGLPDMSQEPKCRCCNCEYSGGRYMDCFDTHYYCTLIGTYHTADHECELTAAERKARKRVH